MTKVKTSLALAFRPGISPEPRCPYSLSVTHCDSPTLWSLLYPSQAKFAIPHYSLIFGSPYPLASDSQYTMAAGCPQGTRIRALAPFADPDRELASPVLVKAAEDHAGKLLCA